MFVFEWDPGSGSEKWLLFLSYAKKMENRFLLRVSNNSKETSCQS